MLADLLDGIEPGAPAINLTVGEPRHPMPGFVIEALDEAKAGFANYPPIRGNAEFRTAVAHWLGRRYPPAAGLDDSRLGIIPLSGTREGLFNVAFSARARKPGTANPALLMPNPFYHAYAGAAVGADLDPVYLNAGADTGFLPDLEAIGADDLDRAAAFFLCSPANPQGAVADAAYLEKAIALARQHDFILVADECYSEVYTVTPPPGVLEIAQEKTGGLANVV